MEEQVCVLLCMGLAWSQQAEWKAAECPPEAAPGRMPRAFTDLKWGVRPWISVLTI